MENDLEEIKLYSDYKSPYAYLAFDPDCWPKWAPKSSR